MSRAGQATSNADASGHVVVGGKYSMILQVVFLLKKIELALILINVSGFTIKIMQLPTGMIPLDTDGTGNQLHLIRGQTIRMYLGSVKKNKTSTAAIHTSIISPGVNLVKQFLELHFPKHLVYDEVKLMNKENQKFAVLASYQTAKGGGRRPPVTGWCVLGSRARVRDLCLGT